MDLERLSTSANLKIPSTSGNPDFLLTLVDPTLPPTSIDLVISLTSVDPALSRLVRCVTFCLLPLPKDECREVRVVEESLG